MLVVQKYGGTSVGSPERIHTVADRIAERHAAGDRLVVVVSAMGETTDELLRLAAAITRVPSRRELDMLLTAGERISMALLSMCLETRSVPAISFTGSQSGIITDTAHTRARILEVRPIRIGPELEKGKVVIVAGFQGVSGEKEVTTLGRGGSDTSAVALAVGLGADRCEIYTDVPGIMSADPRQVEGARLLPRLSWDAMFELARSGAGVMHPRAVALARRRRVPFEVRSAFRKEEGTVIEGNPIEAGAGALAVTGHPEVTWFRIRGARLPDERFAALLGRFQDLFEDLEGLSLTREEGGTAVDFLTPAITEPHAYLDAARTLAAELGGSLAVDQDHATLTVVCAGTVRHASLAAAAGRALAGANVVPTRLLPGNLSLTFFVPRAAYASALQALHAALCEEG